MRKQFSKFVSYGLAVALTLTSFSTGNLVSASAKKATSTSTGGAVTATSTAQVEVPDNPSTFTDMTSDEIITDMGTGWNLGNTLDAHTDYNPSETAWQSIKTTKKFIKALHDRGFNTIRIPVTWGNAINSDYSINEEWISRVQDIVDYATSENMYVIMNMHHDGANNGASDVEYGEEGYDHGWLDITSDDQNVWDNVCIRFSGAWKSIATRFKNYNEHLIFEDMNEVYSVGEGWTADAASISKQYVKINQLNQLFVDAVRSTGSNNSKRWLMVAALNTNVNYALNTYDCSFMLPVDTVSGRLMVSVHDYDNYGRNSTSESTSGSYAAQFKALKEKYVDNGIPVVVGEYGFQTALQADARACKFEGVNYMFRKYKIVGCAWDNNGSDTTGGEGFRLINRSTGNPYSAKSMAGIVRGYFVDSDAPAYIASATDPQLEITSITSIAADTDNVSLTVGNSQTVTTTTEPVDNNDVVLWKSDDATVASVYAGKIVARGVGQTTVYAYALSGEVDKAVTVTVTAQTLANATTAITTDFDAYTLTGGDEAFLNATLVPSNGVSVSFACSDENVATVSTTGKIVAIGDGTATVTVTSGDGFTKKIPVTVSGSTNDSDTATAADEDDDNPKSSTDTTQDNSTDTTLTKGATFTVSGAKYTVTNVSKKTVAYTAPTKKNVTSTTVPATVKVSGTTYKVAAISANAFKGCSKLKKITVKSKVITTVGKNALKGINKKAVIIVPSSKLKAYQKLFKNKGQAKTVTIKK